MGVRIVTDSIADLPLALAEAKRIGVVPLYLTLGGRPYRDGIDLSREQFYSWLPTLRTPPTTATPGPATFRELYERMAQEGARQVVSIHVPSSLSSVANVARLAAEETRSVQVTVLDAGTVSLGLGLVVLAAAEAAEAGASVREVAALVAAQAERVHLLAAVETVEYLRRSGRVSPLLAGLAGVLQVKPVIKLHRGILTAERVRTYSRAVERIVAMVGEHYPWEKLAVVHAGVPQRAEALRQEVLARYPGAGVDMVGEFTPVIGAHTGPGILGLICLARP